MDGCLRQSLINLSVSNNLFVLISPMDNIDYAATDTEFTGEATISTG
jgi:hypothetical protein